jgi:hypothetical protein
LLEAVDALAQVHFRAHGGDVADFFVDDFFRQAEFRDLAADHAAGSAVAVVDHEVVAEGGEIAGDGEGGGAGADEGDFLAVTGGRGSRHAVADVTLVIGGDALEAADGDGLFFHPDAAAGWLTGAIAGASEDPWKDVRIPVDHECVGVSSGGDQTDVFRYRGVGGTGPLAVDHLVEVVGILDVGGLQAVLLSLDSAGSLLR